MAPRKPPKIRLHRPSGRAVLTLSDARSRQRRDFYLGDYGTPEATERGHLLLARWERDGRRLGPAVELARALGLFGAGRGPDPVEGRTPRSVTIRVLCVRYLKHAEHYYRKPDGSITSSVDDARQALRVMRHLFDELPAAAFGPKALQQVRTAMIGRGWSRKTITTRIGHIRKAFKWAAAEELIPAATAQALYTVSGLRRGEQGVKEGRKVKPVPEAHIEAVLAIAPPTLVAMIRVQLATGMRPGELCIMRACDIDLSSDPWAYRPARHKLEHHDRERVIFLGPQAQQAIAPLMPPSRPLDAYLFDPRDAGGRRAIKAVQPRYTRDSYRRAIARLCDEAFPPPEPLRRRKVPAAGRKKWRWETDQEYRIRLGDEGLAELRAWRRRHRWHPHQLRHNAATALRRRYGIEAAKLILGHERIDTTQIYAERDFERAAQIAREVG